MFAFVRSLIVFLFVTSLVVVALLGGYSLSVLGIVVILSSFRILRKVYGVNSYHDAAIKLDELFPLGTKIQVAEALLCSKVGKLFDNAVIASGFRDGNSSIAYLSRTLKPYFKRFGKFIKWSGICKYSKDICNLATLLCDEISYSNVCDPWFGQPSDFHLSPLTTNENQNAFALSLAAKLAYEEDDVIDKVAQELTWTVKTHINNKPKGTQGFIMVKDDNIIVSFRGTEGFNFVDWATDFSISTVVLNTLPMLNAVVPDKLRASVEQAEAIMVPVNNHSQVNVHKGFYDAMMPVYDEVSAAIKSYLSNRKHAKVWVTGHSLGAALASVFVMQAIRTNADWLKKNFGGLYTFGQPRCGDKGYAAVFEPYVRKNQIHRIVLANDIVPRVPVIVKSDHPGYEHHGILTYITSDYQLERPLHPQPYDRVRLLPGIWENFARIAQPDETLMRKLLRVMLPFSVNDHLPFDYSRALQAAIKKTK